MEYITINDLIKALGNLPEEAKEAMLTNICGAVDGVGEHRVSCYQFTIELSGESEYILIPKIKDDECYDSFGKRKINKVCDRDENCEFADLCIEMYEGDISCKGTDNCEHYCAYLEGKCVALES